MTLISTISAIRFGYGLGPSNVPRSGEEILTRLAQGDRIKARYPVKSTKFAAAEATKYRKARKAAQANADGSQLRKDAPAKTCAKWQYWGWCTAWRAFLIPKMRFANV